MRLFGLIGFPLTHSFSKNYFEEKFSNEKLFDCSYQNFPIETIAQFPQLLQQNKNLKGLNVTIPYKEKIIPYLTSLNEAATAIGAVNTIKINAEKATGFNTDYIGFLRSIKPQLKAHHNKALILGTGGSSKAVRHALELLNISYQYVSREKKDNTFLYAEIDKDVLQEHTVIINTTPLGMFPNTSAAPDIKYHEMTRHHLLFDLIYNPAETMFLQKGKAQGATTINGSEMLQIQAEESWKIWNEY